MKRIKYIILLASVGVITGACERDLASEGITEGLIRYPAVSIFGNELVSFVAGEETFTDPGAAATLGADDITDQIEKTGMVNSSTSGMYVLNYSVSVENEIGQLSTATDTRYVAVMAEDLSEVDLSGEYKGTGWASNPIVVNVTKIKDGWYSIEDVLSSGNNISANFAHLGGDEIVIPSQRTPFGIVSTTLGGGEATLTADGFIWTVYISCCGDFGPVTFVKQ